MKSSFCGLATVVLLALSAVPASAADPLPLSSIAALPVPVPLKTPAANTVLGVTVKQDSPKWVDLTTATSKGYCVVTHDGGARYASTFGTSIIGNIADVDIDRLVEKDGKVTLERTRAQFDPTRTSVTAVARSHVELKEIARHPSGVVVWAYRDGGFVVVIARRATSGIEARTVAVDDQSLPSLGVDSCPFAGVRVDARKADAGSMAQLAISMPTVGEGKQQVTPRFLVDASVSRVTRDPEPLLAIRVRSAN